MRDSPFAASLAAALRHALAHLESLDDGPVAPTANPDSIRDRLGRPLSFQGTAPERVIDDLVSNVEGGLLGCAGGRFFGWVIGGSLPAALAADWLTAAWDQNAALHSCSPAAAIVEEVVGDWLKDILGLPTEASFALVSGGQMANLTCLAAARHALLAKQGWDVEERGLFGAPRIRLLSGQRHGSVDRAVRLLGIGREQIASLSLDAGDRVDPLGLEEALRADSRLPTIVLLQAGDINTGSYDPFETLIPIAHRHGAWVHVDGAFGLWAAASPRFSHLVRDVGFADSWATDGHKWLNVPYDSGYAFVGDPDAHSGAMSYRASYLTHDVAARDQIDWNPEWSRRARGFPTYAALRQLGRGGVAELVERCSRHARRLVLSIGVLPGAEVLSEPSVNQGLVRFLDYRSHATAEDHNRRTDEVIGSILETGEAFFTGTDWQGQRAMRVSVCNWQTSDEDVDRVIRAVAGVLDDV